MPLRTLRALGTLRALCVCAGGEGSGRVLCAHREILWRWLLLLLWSLAEVPVELFYPVAVLLVGARTRSHLDSFYGGQANVARITRPGGVLVVDYRIPFRQCVLRYGPDFFVPLGLSQKKGEVLRLLQLLPNGRGRVTTAYNLEWMYSEQVKVVGYLPYLVLSCNQSNKVVLGDGTKCELNTNSLISIVPEYDPGAPESTLLKEPAEATWVTSTAILADAREHSERPQSMRRPVTFQYTSEHCWFAFNGWQYIHWWQGDPYVARVNLYSRPMRQES